MISDVAPSTLDLERDGACLAVGVAADTIGELESLLTTDQKGEAGLRLTGCSKLAQWVVERSGVLPHVGSYMGIHARPVRAVLFDKNDAVNWTLGWHQDRTIAVRRREDVPAFGPWSVKQGICHVEPPFAVIEAMMTVRIHLDPVDAENAPLLIACGSHGCGRVAAHEAEAVAMQHRVQACLAERGDAWMYRTPILHASGRVTKAGRRRRVLQVDFSATELPAPLEWLGLGR
ncbi:phytanoyl-CoA dioxygenase family protein [Novosphingobium sp. 9]|uniref:phytanoyl-CoA dioxygenase family protein n=1 Tax=Novosphingobium sp. 9 TaxID=2025349 RepID=UPI0021B69276|nr:phytanoyl-CoA dioxygenase family protein [Novosphingobium sp. 9]